ncbi:MAG: hypothetical protein QOG09_181 [Solirubrobacterales bacterium]|jgi:hypothetical protein|nr:hypothetical protein [Solirubrobacterales bacterium]
MAASGRNLQIVQATVVLTLLSIAHAVDHTVGHPAHGVGLIPGYLGFFILGATLYLALRGDARAPLAAAATGFATAIGLLAIHIAPHWGMFSDPYSKLDLGPVSWAIVLVSIVVGIWLGVAGMRAMREPLATA